MPRVLKRDSALELCIQAMWGLLLSRENSLGVNLLSPRMRESLARPHDSEKFDLIPPKVL